MGGHWVFGIGAAIVVVTNDGGLGKLVVSMSSVLSASTVSASVVSALDSVGHISGYLKYPNHLSQPRQIATSATVSSNSLSLLSSESFSE